jgi:hypothetical protein
VRKCIQNLVGKSEEKTSLGRPRRRWVYNIKMNLKLGICVDWVILAQDRDQGWALVSTVTNGLHSLKLLSLYDICKLNSKCCCSQFKLPPNNCNHCSHLERLKQSFPSWSAALRYGFLMIGSPALRLSFMVGCPALWFPPFLCDLREDSNWSLCSHYYFDTYRRISIKFRGMLVSYSPYKLECYGIFNLLK